MYMHVHVYMYMSCFICSYKQVSPSRLLFSVPQPLLYGSLNYFKLIGIVCGLAIYNSVIIDLPFPTALYKKILRK